MKKFNFVAVVLFVMLFTGCSEEGTLGDGNEVNTLIPIELTKSESEVSDQANIFAWKMFLEMEKVSQGENVLFSPLGVTSSLAMTANGAEGETLEEITGVVGFTSLEAVNSYYKKISDRVGDLDKESVLKIANGLFVNSDLAITSVFKSAIQGGYSAEMQNLPLLKSSQIEVVSTWCREKTDGMIPQAISSLPDQTSLLLVNALNFAGSWGESCKFEKCGNRNFYCSDGTEHSVAFMKQQSGCSSRCNANDTMVGFSILFGNGAFSMNIYQPQEGYTMADCAEWFTTCSRIDFVRLSNGSLVSLSMPKFEMSTSDADIIPALKSMGISRIFDYDASQLSKIVASGESVFFSKFSQSNKIKVDEKGATFASATVGGGAVTAVLPDGSYEINRPFIYTIEETGTGTIIAIYVSSG